jgi:hypothetical protein
LSEIGIFSRAPRYRRKQAAVVIKPQPGHMGGCLGRFREERWLLCFPSRFVFGPGRSRQEQSDRREPVPAEHESLTLKNVKARRVGSAARFGGHHLARFYIIPRLPEFGSVYHYFQAWQNSAPSPHPSIRRRPSISAIIVRKLDQRSIRMSK